MIGTAKAVLLGLSRGIGSLVGSNTISTTPTNPAATAYSNQKKAAVLSTGREVLVIGDTTTNAKFYWTDDKGATKTDFAADIAGWSNGSIYAYVDSGGTERLMAVWKQSGTGGGRTDTDCYLMVGTFNTARTSISWGTPVSLLAGAGSYGYPDMIATPYSTGGAVMIVLSYTNGSVVQAAYKQGTISGTTPTLGSLSLLGGNYTSSTPGSFPSIDIDPTTQRVHAAWSAGAIGAGVGVRYSTASFSAGTWTWAATEVEVATGYYILGDVYGLICRWDGTRAVIGGMLWTGSANKLEVWDSTAFTSFTNRIDASLTDAAQIYGPGMAIDPTTGDVYLTGGYFVTANYRAAGYYKATRLGSSLSLGSYTITDSTTGSTTQPGHAYAWCSNDAIRWLYTTGSSSPYTVKYGNLT